MNGSTVSYTYDAAGNITSITDGSLVTYYTYDSLNQLIREDNAYSNKTVVYTYDNGGTLLTKTEYPYSPTVADITALTPTNTVTYTYGNADWKDQLTSFNGEAITYDAIGNPLTYRGMTLTWQNGRELASITKAGLSASYVYNDSGLRTGKTVNGSTTEYYWDDTRLLAQKTNGEYLYFLYDENGSMIGFTLDGLQYLYVRNLQGDIVSVVSASTGASVAEYTYDSWGNILTATGTMAEVNPIRYRGYYLDAETGLYYLQSRYYDAEVGRFLNADIILVNESTATLNLFSYCANTPTSYYDETGYCRIRFDGVKLNDCHSLGCPYAENITIPDIKAEIKSYEFSLATKRPNFQPRKDKKKGSESRQPTGDRERNVAHPNGEEHSRVPKGNGVRKNVNESAEKIGENLVTAAAAAASLYAVYLTIKWIAAAALAVPTAGGSIAVAALTP